MSLFRTGYFSSAANVLTKSPKIWHVNKTDFFHLKWLRSYPWIIYRWCDPDLNTAWARLPCYLSKVPLKHDFLDIYLTTFSESVISKIQNLWELSFVSKCLKFNLDFWNAAKNSDKLFSFWDNCIWIGIVKLFLLRTVYFSSTANVWKSSPKICFFKKREFSEHNFFVSDQWIWWRCCDADFSGVWARLPYCLSKHPLKRAFLNIYLTTFSESVISEIQKLWASSLYSKCLNFI